MLCFHTSAAMCLLTAALLLSLLGEYSVIFDLGVRCHMEHINDLCILQSNVYVRDFKPCATQDRESADCQQMVIGRCCVY